MLKVVTALFFLFLSSQSLAVIYIYETQNGKKVVTDKLLFTKGYRLIHASENSRETSKFIRYQALANNQENLDRWINVAAATHAVDSALIKAVIKQESNFSVTAISKKGARGLMQLMPNTAKMYGVKDSYNPEENILAGTKHLRYLLNLYSNNLDLALAAYNAGEGNVRKYGGIPPFKETKNYVIRVNKHYKQYARKQRGKLLSHN